MSKLNLEEGIVRRNKKILEDLKSLEYDFNAKKINTFSTQKIMTDRRKK